ncbi:5'/3'-nucleotidase SurE [Nissabacter sp. SGAir0207]|uniref:5'/3'-nucleotidase SurE n=1 Tax=Nissabacter sp. SGAir0207 TaxID=2126321 RepID=UPI0010CD643D|nr:5'/3'-nucleotidase SurE [Nissabacter sp. SGAir0207]QCR38119.1 5'/3'-nucleotidase SurE [Nissabacter sp. SGAir0207]
MSEKPLRRVLLSNDDGIDAPGMALLADIAALLADEVWIVAPATDKSGVSNSVSLREPVRVEPRGPRRYAVHGTPADCVTLAVRHLMKDAPPDVLLSGINSGSNIGFETVLSGTVGAAITGVLLGIPSVALSQDKPQDAAPEWQVAEQFCLPVLARLLEDGLPEGCCLNVNFPHLPVEAIKGVKVSRQGIGKVKGLFVTPTTDPHGEEYFWIRVEHGVTALPAHSEVAAVADGYISVTPLTFERTDRDAWDKLASRFNQG